MPFRPTLLATCLLALAAPIPALADPHDRALQMRLMQDGFYDGAIDGIIGPASRRAFSDYAAAHGLADDYDEIIPHLFESARPLRHEVTDGQRRAVEIFLERELRDGEAARIEYTFSYLIQRDPQIFEESETWIVCGEVNAPNAYGGFTGYQPFNVSLMSFSEDRHIGGVLAMGELAAAMCYLGTHILISVD